VKYLAILALVVVSTAAQAQTPTQPPARSLFAEPLANDTLDPRVESDVERCFTITDVNIRDAPNPNSKKKPYGYEKNEEVNILQQRKTPDGHWWSQLGFFADSKPMGWVRSKYLLCRIHDGEWILTDERQDREQAFAKKQSKKQAKN